MLPPNNTGITVTSTVSTWPESRKERKSSLPPNNQNIFAVPSLQRSYPIWIQLGDDSHIRVVLLFHCPREYDGSDSCERSLAPVSCLQPHTFAYPSAECRIVPRSQRNRLPGRCQSSLLLRSGQQYSHPNSSPLHNEFSALTYTPIG